MRPPGSFGPGRAGDDDLFDVGGDGRIIFDDLPAIKDDPHGHLKAGGDSGEVVAQDEVSMLRQASQSPSHPLLGVLLDDADVAQAVAFALLYGQPFFYQLLVGVAHG